MCLQILSTLNRRGASLRRVSQSIGCPISTIWGSFTGSCSHSSPVLLRSPLLPVPSPTNRHAGSLQLLVTAGPIAEGPILHLTCASNVLLGKNTLHSI